mmetsp:Transcript_158921/g.506055  ORF Transcript_158921/g.506055 Transcript_158921/m.506055 type:complete len:111 (+) Transcript_158921:194-526(+)
MRVRRSTLAPARDRDVVVQDEDGKLVYSWPRKDSVNFGDSTNSACGVAVVLSKHKFRRSDVLCTYAPSSSFTGRAGTIGLKRKGVFDFIVFSVYMPVERGAKTSALLLKL